MKKKTQTKNCFAAHKVAAQMTPQLISDLKKNNHILAADSNTPRHGLGTYANPADKLYGAKGAITKALISCHATFADGVENTAQRSAAIRASLFFDEIFRFVKLEAGNECFCKSMIRNCLWLYMPKDGTLGTIHLRNDEDQPRHCRRPRKKYYLIKN